MTNVFSLPISKIAEKIRKNIGIDLDTTTEPAMETAETADIKNESNLKKEINLKSENKEDPKKEEPEKKVEGSSEKK